MANTNALQRADNVTSLAVDDGMFSDRRLELIRNTVAKGAPEDVFVAMVDIAKRRNLDPLAKQIGVMKFGSDWVVFTPIDGYRATAEQTGQYAGQDAPVFTWPTPAEFTSAKKRIPDSATVTVYKLINGQRYPFTATVYWEEYNAGRANWLTMPRTMLAKVAESHALRKAFPAVTSGTYAPEELDQAVEVEGRVVDRGTGVIRDEAPQRQPRQVAPRAQAVNQDDNKAKYHRNQIRKLAEPLGWTDAEFDHEAMRKFGAPFEALVTADAERMQRDFEGLKRDQALGDLLRSVQAELVDLGDVYEVEGEVIEP
jgi:phage recombination protein Bet